MRTRRVPVVPHVEGEVGSARSLLRLKTKLLPSHVRSGLEPIGESRSCGGAMAQPLAIVLHAAFLL
jgi:hypothetical protein